MSKAGGHFNQLKNKLLFIDVLPSLKHQYQLFAQTNNHTFTALFSELVCMLGGIVKLRKLDYFMIISSDLTRITRKRKKKLIFPHMPRNSVAFMPKEYF